MSFLFFSFLGEGKKLIVFFVSVPKTCSFSSISQGMHYPSSLSHSLHHHNKYEECPAGPGGGPERGGGSTPSASTPSASSPLRGFISLGGGGGKRHLRGNWPEIKDVYEYAVTITSTSSEGGRA